MDFDGQTSLLNIIEQDLGKTERELFRSAFSDHELLANQARELQNLPLAALFLAAASLGDYRSEELRPVAVGLELLRLAAEKHYKEKADGSVSRNLSLVTADFYYAQAISLAAKLKRGYVVEQMVKAIAELASEEAAGSKGETSFRSDVGVGLFRAAARLGILLGNCRPDLAGTLDAFALSLGRIYRMHSGEASTHRPGFSIELNQIKERAFGSLRGLPAEQGRFLKALVSSLLLP